MCQSCLRTKYDDKRKSSGSGATEKECNAHDSMEHGQWIEAVRTETMALIDLVS